MADVRSHHKLLSFCSLDGTTLASPKMQWGHAWHCLRLEHLLNPGPGFYSGSVAFSYGRAMAGWDIPGPGLFMSIKPAHLSLFRAQNLLCSYYSQGHLKSHSSCGLGRHVRVDVLAGGHKWDPRSSYPPFGKAAGYS